MKIACHFHLTLSILFFAAVIYSKAQPSGDEYGPIKQVYDLPSVKGKTYFVATNGKTVSDGLRLDRPTTIESAIERVVTGDAIVMRGGIYRTGNLTFNQGITIQPYADEHPVLKGTLVASEWKKVNDGLWSIQWEYLFPAGPEDWWNRDREEKHTPLHRFNNDGVFIDGKYLQSSGSIEELDTNTFYVDYDAKTIYIGTNPLNRFIEITAFRKAIFRTTGECHGKKSDGRGPVIRGLEITQYPDTMVHIDGYYPQGISAESHHGKDVVGSLLEHCIFSNCFRIGAFLIGDSLIMRHCEVSNTNTEGVYIVASSDVLLEKNIFRHNNIERWTGFYPAAVKIFNQTYRVTCRDNLVVDHPFSNGIWYDVGNVDGIFINNWVERVGRIDKPFRKDQIWPCDNGFFFEISKGAICAGNVFVDCDHGILILNSCDAEVYNNTFINSMACFARTDRGDSPDHFGWHPSTGPGVDERDGHIFINNISYIDINYPKPLLFVWQTTKLCQRLSKPQFAALDHNVYVRKNLENNTPLILWSPFNNEKCQIDLNSPEAMNQLYPEFSAGSLYYEDYKLPLFENGNLKNFRLSGSFPGINAGTTIPEKVKSILEIPAEDKSFIGAYPAD